MKHYHFFSKVMKRNYLRILIKSLLSVMSIVIYVLVLYGYVWLSVGIVTVIMIIALFN